MIGQANGTDEVIRYWNDLASACTAEGLWADAFDLYSQVATYPKYNTTALWIALGKCHYELGRPERAKETLEQSMFRRNRGDACLLTVTRIVSSVLQVDPSNHPGKLELARALQALNETQAAKELVLQGMYWVSVSFKCTR